MFASQVAEYGEQAIAFSAIGFFKRPRAVRQFGRRGGPRLDEAMKAGIGATICSIIILAIMVLVLHAMPIGIG
jgi:hypothetical protein